MNAQKISPYRFLYLLFFLLVFFILNTFMADTREEAYVFGILFSTIVFCAAWVIQRGKWLLPLTALLAVLSLIGVWTNLLLNLNHTLMIIEYALFILFFLLITIIVLSNVVGHKVVTLNTLCGAICGYLLIALTWALAYVLMFYLNHNAFHMPDVDPNRFAMSSQLFIYYSFVTQSTLGFGDITPLSKIAETFSWLQAITGQIYLTVWLAQLVGLHIANKTANKERAQ